MAFYQYGIVTTANQLVADFKILAEANGWTIDLFTTYLTYNRVHLHKGSSHFEVYATAGTAFSVVGCTGYSSGAIPTAQPGATAAKDTGYVTANYGFCLISTAGGLYIGHFSNGHNYWCWAGICTLQAKIGTWADGIICFNSYSQPFNISAYTSGESQLYINGAWTPSVAAGGFCGSVGSDLDMCAKQPMEYNAGILPIPITLFVRLVTDYTKFQPIGFAPGMYRCNGGNIYTTAEEIPVGADTYLIMPCNGATIGLSSHDLLFKLGA
jgi:hypothetical protein